MLRRKAQIVHPLLLAAVHVQSLLPGPGQDPLQSLLGVVQPQEEIPLAEIRVQQPGHALLCALLVLLLLFDLLLFPPPGFGGAFAGYPKLCFFTHGARLIGPHHPVPLHAAPPLFLFPFYC